MDETVARAGMFQGLESAVAAVIKQLQPVDFARRRTVFAEGEPADSPQVPDDASGLAVDPRIPDRIRANRVALANQILTQASVCSASVTTSASDPRSAAQRPVADCADLIALKYDARTAGGHDCDRASADAL